MKKYLSYFKLRFNVALQYRVSAIGGMLTQFFWAIMQILVYKAFFKVSVSSNISLDELISYVWLKQAFYTIISGTTDREIKMMVESGNVAYELCRPTELYWMWYFKTLANRMAGGFLKCIPILAISPLLPTGLALKPPIGIIECILFIITLFLAVCLMSAIINVFYISLFYTMSSRGTNSFFYAIIEFFGGTFVPIALMPDFWQKLCYILPISLACDLPFRIYTGNISVIYAIPYIIMQIVWIAILTISGNIITNKRLQKIAIQGG